MSERQVPTTVRDRSGQGLPSKSERRALGKAAAQKRAKQRRRRELRNRVVQIAGPFVAVAVIIGAVWLFSGGNDGATDDLASTPDANSPSQDPGVPPVEQPAEPWTLPEGLDPQLGTAPVVTAGEGDVTELKVTTLVQGTGAPLATGDVIQVNYVGVNYASGEEFDSSWSRGEPASFPIGVGQVIPGWDQGLVGVPIGSRVQLDIPVELAYNNQPGYPEGDLRFVVDVLGVEGA
jgi:peptidylprolyl isomerase